VRNLEKVLNEILVKLLSIDNKVSDLDNKFFNLDNKVTNLEVGQQQIVSRLDTLETDVKEIRDTVNRIEVSQNEDVISLLKMMHKQKH
jgi:peptidoglycan hydrolase CwlO-like protein